MFLSLGCSFYRSPWWGNLDWFLYIPPLIKEMFATSLRGLPRPMYSAKDRRHSSPAVSPFGHPPDFLITRSPGLIAVTCVSPSSPSDANIHNELSLLQKINLLQLWSNGRFSDLIHSFIFEDRLSLLHMRLNREKWMCKTLVELTENLLPDIVKGSSYSQYFLSGSESPCNLDL